MSDPGSNPVLVDGPHQEAPIVRDNSSNPSTYGQKIGGETAPNPHPGVPQTTIDVQTTTIHPEASIVNPVTPDGGPAHGVKKQAPPPSVAAKVDEQVKQMQANKSAGLGGVGSVAKPGGVK